MQNSTGDEQGEGGGGDRLEQLDQRIGKARSQAEEAGVLTDETEERYIDSGQDPEDDDQSIAPPG